MICIEPMAPLGDNARTSWTLCARITARIQDAGIANRCDASATMPAIRSVVTTTPLGFVPIGSPCATLMPTSSTTVVELHRQSRQIAFRRLFRRQTVAGDMAGPDEDANRPAWTGAGLRLQNLDILICP